MLDTYEGVGALLAGDMSAQELDEHEHAALAGDDRGEGLDAQRLGGGHHVRAERHRGDRAATTQLSEHLGLLKKAGADDDKAAALGDGGLYAVHGALSVRSERRLAS